MDTGVCGEDARNSAGSRISFGSVFAAIVVARFAEVERLQRYGMVGKKKCG
jgi:hypothetical protein